MTTVSGVNIDDVRTLRSLRSTRIIEAFNLHAAVHYQLNDSMPLARSFTSVSGSVTGGDRTNAPTGKILACRKKLLLSKNF